MAGLVDVGLALGVHLDRRVGDNLVAGAFGLVLQFVADLLRRVGIGENEGHDVVDCTTFLVTHGDSP